MIAVKSVLTRWHSSSCDAGAENAPTICNRVSWFVLTCFVISCSFFPALVYADVLGDCEEDDDGTCLPAYEDSNCKITIDGVVKPGKCKTTTRWIGSVCKCEPNDGTKVGETKAYGTGTGAILEAPTMMTFDISPEPEGSMSLVPERFGGGVVFVLSFSGTVTVQSMPTFDPDMDLIEVVGGVVMAPSVELPNGMLTGPSTFEFIGPGSTPGWLNRLTGEFYFSAVGQLTNAIFPASNPVQTIGDYFGTVDMATGIAIVDTRTFDFLPACPATTIPGDISGPLGVPDGYVNMWDLAELAKNWLRYQDCEPTPEELTPPPTPEDYVYIGYDVAVNSQLTESTIPLERPESPEDISVIRSHTIVKDGVTITVCDVIVRHLFAPKVDDEEPPVEPPDDEPDPNKPKPPIPLPWPSDPNKPKPPIPLPWPPDPNEPDPNEPLIIVD